MKLHAPEALAFGSDGLYVSEYAGGRVDSTDEKSLVVYPTRFVAPTGLAVAPDGTLFVVDHRGDRVVAISPDRSAHTVLGSVAAHLSDPIGIAFDPHGGIDVADEQNHRIVRIAPDGRTTVLVRAPAISHPSYLVRDRKGDLYFTDFADNRIRKLDRRGVLSVVAPKVRLNFRPGSRLRAATSTSRTPTTTVSCGSLPQVLPPWSQATARPASPATAARRPKRS